MPSYSVARRQEEQRWADSYYLSIALTPANLDHIRRRLVPYLRTFERRVAPFEALAVRGTSGLLVSGMMAAATGKHLLVVRKENESSHTSARVEGFKPRVVDEAGAEEYDAPMWDHRPFNYVVLDDFVCSGETVRACVEDIQVARPRARCVGIVQYQREVRWGSETTVGTVRKLSEAGHVSYTQRVPLLGVNCYQ